MLSEGLYDLVAVMLPTEEQLLRIVLFGGLNAVHLAFRGGWRVICDVGNAGAIRVPSALL